VEAPDRNHARAQQQQLVDALNARPNHHIHAQDHSNFANFAADIFSFYYPGLVKRNRWAGLGFLLPKQLARSIHIYRNTHPEAPFRVIEILRSQAQSAAATQSAAEPKLQDQALRFSRRLPSLSVCPVPRLRQLENCPTRRDHRPEAFVSLPEPVLAGN
jgi:hypothetical protein